MMPISRTARAASSFWLIVALGLLLGACGFQPRGQGTALAGMPRPLFISGIGRFSDLHRELERQLKTAGIALAPSAADSAAVLRIARWDSTARLLAVNSRNKAVEYELEEAARFSLHSSDGRELVGEQTARVIRIQFQPQQAVLGSEREGAVLRDDMRRQLAEQILRRSAAPR